MTAASTSADASDLHSPSCLQRSDTGGSTRPEAPRRRPCSRTSKAHTSVCQQTCRGRHSGSSGRPTSREQQGTGGTGVRSRTRMSRGRQRRLTREGGGDCDREVQAPPWRLVRRAGARGRKRSPRSALLVPARVAGALTASTKLPFVRWDIVGRESARAETGRPNGGSAGVVLP